MLEVGKVSLSPAADPARRICARSLMAHWLAGPTGVVFGLIPSRAVCAEGGHS